MEVTGAGYADVAIVNSVGLRPFYFHAWAAPRVPSTLRIARLLLTPPRWITFSSVQVPS